MTKINIIPKGDEQLKNEIPEDVYIYYAIWWNQIKFRYYWLKLNIVFTLEEYHLLRSRGKELKRIYPYTTKYYDNIVNVLNQESK